MISSWIGILLTTVINSKRGMKGYFPVVNNIIWLFTQRGISIFLSLSIGVLVARYLKPEQFGILSYALALITIFQPLSNLGLSSIITRELVANDRESGQILGTAFVVRLCGGISSFLVLIGIVLFFPFENSQLKLCIAILSLGNLFQPFGVIDFWFQSQVLSKYVVISQSLVLVVGASLKLALLSIQAPLTLFIIVFGFEGILNSISLIFPYYIKEKSFTNWNFDFLYGKRLLSQSWPLILSGFGSIIYLKIDQIMLGNMSTKEVLGNYAIATRLSETWYFIPTAIVSSVFPSLLKSKLEGIKIYHQKLQRLYDNLALLAIFIAIPTTFFSTPLVVMLYGNSYRSAGIILSIHIWAGVFIFMRAALSKWLIAEDLLIFSLITHSLGAIVNVLLNLLLIPNYDGLGAAIATVISYATSSYISLFISCRTIKMAKMMTLSLFYPIRIIKDKFV